MRQGEAGTSTNANVNEVLVNLALLKMRADVGDYSKVHPNNDVNRPRLTNDVYSMAIRLTILWAYEGLIAADVALRDAFRAKPVRYSSALKVSRAQSNEAVPMTAGQEFQAFAELIDEDIIQVQYASKFLREINLGGSAIGTAINVPSGFAQTACGHLSQISGYRLIPARNFIEATSNSDGFVSISGVLKHIAVKLTKICNDLRLLSSGARGGLGELRLPPVQAGSSIMPGKFNPVIPEMVNQISFQVIGNDLTVTLAGSAGQLQLNAMEPVIVLNILQSMPMLTRGMVILKKRCIEGIDVDHCQALLDQSLLRATPLAKLIGYREAAYLSEKALVEKRNLRDVVEKERVLTEDQVHQIFGNTAEFANFSRSGWTEGKDGRFH